jgi:HlyD family secretion protein
MAQAMSALPGSSATGTTGDGTATDTWGHDSAASGGATDPATVQSTSTGTDPATGAGGTTTTDTGAFSALTVPVGSDACSNVASAQSALTNAERQVVVSRTARDQARQQRDVDEAAGRVSVENARSSLVSAQNNLASSATDRPSTIAQQQAVIDGAVAAVQQAQQGVDDTVLRAPVDGTVSALNGAVGEYVQSGSVTSALAPGSGAAIPGTGGAAASGNDEVARPGGTQFIVLDGVETFEVVVPFEQSDAARIAPDQNVDVSFDAVPDLVRHGTVMAIGPAATSTSSVVSYYVTVVLTDTDPRLRDGQTAEAAVHTDEVRDVPAVPNAAVHRQGGQTTVTVIGFDGSQRTVPFQAGAVGDTFTEVRSGLTVGDQVVVTPGV